MTLQETEPDLLIVLESVQWRCRSALVCHGDRGISSSSPGGGGGLPLTLPDSSYPQGWITSGQTTKREGAQPHTSTANWIGVLLSMALTTRARPSFSQNLLSGRLNKSLSLIHKKVDRRSKKNHNSAVSRTTTTSQKVNQDEKAELFVPDKGAR